jgi:hypothetical protein
MNKTVSNFLLGFLAGAAAGALMGVLLAPDRGSKTRQNFKKKVRELSDQYGLGLGELIDEAEMETLPEEEEEPAADTKIPKAKLRTKAQKPPVAAKRKYNRKSKLTSDQ